MIEKKRPHGITIFGILILIFSSIGLIFYFAAPLISLPNPPISFTRQYIKAIPFLIFFILLFIVGLGVMNLKKWSPRLVIIFSIIGLLWVLYKLYSFAEGYIYIEPLIIGIIYFIIVIGFLVSLVVFFTRPKVKEQFK